MQSKPVMGDSVMTLGRGLDLMRNGYHPDADVSSFHWSRERYEVQLRPDSIIPALTMVTTGFAQASGVLCIIEKDSIGWSHPGRLAAASSDYRGHLQVFLQLSSSHHKKHVVHKLSSVLIVHGTTN